MDLSLPIIAAAASAMILMAAASYYFLRAKQQTKNKFSGGAPQSPLSIQLDEEPDPEWSATDEAQELIEGFKTLGFYKGKAYIIHEMQDIKMQSLFFGDFAAIVYNHPHIGYWAELAFQGDEEYFYVASNAPLGYEIKTHPKTKRIYKSNATAIDLYNQLKHEVSHVKSIRIKEENFQDIYESYYRRDMNWRNNNGGITIQEFKSNLKRANEKLNITKEDLRRVFLETKVDELHQWHKACITEFLEQTKEESFDYSDIKHQLFIVPNRTISQAFIEYLEDFEIIHSAVKNKLVNALRKKTNIPKIFEMINSSFSRDMQAEVVGQVNAPLEAQIYKRSHKLAR